MASKRGARPKSAKQKAEEQLADRLWSGGRPGNGSVLADEQMRGIFLMALQNAVSFKAASKAAGWSSSNLDVWKKLAANNKTVYGADSRPVRWQRANDGPYEDLTYADWVALVEGARSVGRIRTLGRLDELSMQGKDLHVALTATLKKLQLLWPKLYTPATKSELTGKDGAPLVPPHAPQEEVRGILDALSKKLDDAERTARETEPGGTPGTPAPG